MTMHGVIFSLTVLLLSQPLYAQKDTLSPESIERIDAAMLAEMQRQEAVGLAIGVIRDGRIAYLKGYGMADRAVDLPVTKETMFRWASVSKLLTAIATMQLVEQGKLDLDDDVRDYVPEFPDHGERITVRDLLCHQSGIVHYSNGKVIRTKRKYKERHPFADAVTALDTFKKAPLVAPPGEKFSYTSHGFILLSAVVERAGGEPFAEQVQKRIARPLGLNTLQPDYQWIEIPQRVKGYRRLNGEIVDSTDTDVSWKLGAGGFISTIEDMARFATAIARGRLLRSKTWQEVSMPQRTASEEVTEFGLGFSVSGEGQKLKLSHNGGQEKVSTRLVVYPGQGSGVVVMCNSEHASPGRFSTLVYSAL
jgi:serine beta-lactamase-like protein LACTB, mitochondrial